MHIKPQLHAHKTPASCTKRVVGEVGSIEMGQKEHRNDENVQNEFKPTKTGVQNKIEFSSEELCDSVV